MKFFIQIKGGQPFEHPITEDNIHQAFPELDIDNLPNTFANFQRVPVPTIGTYEVYEGVTYEWFGGIVKDVHHVRSMTDEEKLNKQNKVKQNWASGLGWSSWTFNEQTCTYDPPVPYPNDEKRYRWDEPTLSWIEI